MGYDDLVEDSKGWVDAAASFLGALGMAVRTGAEGDAEGFVRPTLRHVGADRSSDQLRRGSPIRADPGEKDLALEVEHLLAVLGSLEGSHPSFAPPPLDDEAPEVEAELSARWPDRPPVWNDPPWPT